MGATSTRTEDGRQRVYPSCRPYGTTTYFTGAGDDTGVGDGERLLFKLAATDASKSVTLTFNEDVHIKDGYMIARGAPFGAYVDIEVLHPQAGVVGCFGKKVPILGDGWFPLNTEDHSETVQGLQLRITVFNSDNSDGIQDAPADFVLAGRIEMFRENTV